jgi:hypothetical protein
MKDAGMSRRTFIRGTVGAAGSAFAASPAVLRTNSASLQTQADAQVDSPSLAQCSADRLERASKDYAKRFSGPRWRLVYGAYLGAEEFALNELQRTLQRFVPYVLEIHPAAAPLHPDANHVLIGTPENNPLIADLIRKGILRPPTTSEGYSSICIPSPLNPERRFVVIAGHDAAGVLYGVISLNKRLVKAAPDDPAEMRATLDTLANFTEEEHPLVEDRGIWAWGYTIYNYRQFIDNMARLRMNKLNFWNDVPPLNCRAVIDYAHSRGIKVVLGFSWGYDLSTLDPGSSADRQVIKENVLCQIAAQYQHLGMDAIYFQTFTETNNVESGGKPIAELATSWVNDIAGTVLSRYPQLKIEWGLHASSIQDNYTYLKALDPRVVIVWEDAGVIPYSYDPLTTNPVGDVPAALNSPQGTLEYSKKLATVRGHSQFSMVAKGWIQMRWRTESEHHGLYIMGERAEVYIRNRARERQPRWDFINNLWLENYPDALRFFAGIRDCTPAGMSVLGLVEDGLLEERIQPSVALFAEILWSPHQTERQVLERAMNPYYTFVA